MSKKAEKSETIGRTPIAITPPGSPKTALVEPSPQNMDDLFGDVAGVPVGVTLPVVKIGKETANFEVGGKITDTLIGNLLLVSSFNIYYKGKYDPKSPEPPMCSSSNGIAPDGGTEPQSQSCANCKQNEFVETLGSRPCQNRTMVYFLEEDSVVPVLLNLAPTNRSKKAGPLGIWSCMGSLINMVAAWKLGQGQKATGKERYQQVRVKMTLKEVTFQNGSANVLQVEGLEVVNDIDAVKLIAAKAADAKRDYTGVMEDLVAEGKAGGDDHLAEDKKSDDCPI